MKRLFSYAMALVVWLSVPLVAKESVDESPLPIVAERAFPNLKFVRPVVLTGAGDGSDRIFVVSQLGAIHVFPNDQAVDEAKLFLDLSDQVVFSEREFEEGLLGLAFHPNYKSNGQFFLYYTKKGTPHTSVISRFRVSQDDPNRAELESEEEVFRIKQPYWNHNGGTITFGPDGYLYIGMGDGGYANDPHMNGQNLQTFLGSILRIDIDHKTPKDPEHNRSRAMNYAIPQDNPFVGFKLLARPEIWAYGVRNIWRLAFDRKTGACWAADVGQDLWEEINIIERGGNYGWNLREGMHKFGPRGAGLRDDLIEPIWEYHHDVGKSITGGFVYRGKRLPELAGAYLYADFVTGNLWALRYDTEKKRVLANRTITGNTMPVLSFGEDEQGEVYFLTDKGTIHRFRRNRGG